MYIYIYIYVYIYIYMTLFRPFAFRRERAEPSGGRSCAEPAASVRGSLHLGGGQDEHGVSPT